MNDHMMQELKRFLLDIDCLCALENTTFNVFDVLKISRTEIRHSNVLAWLLDPNANHGYSHNFLARLNSYLARDGFVSDKDVFKLLTMKYMDVIVLREWQNIDILIESKDEKYVLCIENKVDSQDHSGQLDKYYDIIEEKYSQSGGEMRSISLCIFQSIPIITARLNSSGICFISRNFLQITSIP